MPYIFRDRSNTQDGEDFWSGADAGWEVRSCRSIYCGGSSITSWASGAGGTSSMSVCTTTRAPGLAALIRPPEDGIELPVSPCLAKPSMLELRREGCIGSGEGGSLAVKLPAEAWPVCDRAAV